MLLSVSYAFCMAEPLMGSLPSVSCRKVSVQRLLRCRILFCSSLQRAAREVVLLLAAPCFPKMHCCLQFPQGKGQALLLCLPGTREERLNHTRWQGRSVPSATSGGLSHAAVVAACSGGRARGSRDPAPCVGSCYVLLSGRPVDGKCTCQQSVMQLQVGN